MSDDLIKRLRESRATWSNEGGKVHACPTDLEAEAAAALSEARAEIARLSGLLIAEREETLWNAYHTGHEGGGMWDHCCMSDGEWLVRECGFDPADRAYPADAIKAAIPNAARAALEAKHG